MTSTRSVRIRLCLLLALAVCLSQGCNNKTSSDSGNRGPRSGSKG